MISAKFLNSARASGFDMLTNVASKDSFITRWGRHMAYGVAMAAGAEPIEQVGKNTVWRWFGKEFTSNAGEPFLQAVHNGRTSGGIGAVGGSLMQVVSTGSVLAATFATQGFMSTASMATMEVALQGAMAKHAYTTLADGTMHSGRSILAKAFHKNSWTHFGLNQADYFGRMAGGLIAGKAASAILGGGLLGTAVAPFAASLGVRAGNRLTIPALAAGAVAAGAYGMARVGTSALKAGYNHAQMQKAIHTSGDMAAFSTSGANTMRQRAVMAIAKSQLNARSALGQEASYMSMPSRSYHSRYKQAY